MDYVRGCWVSVCGPRRVGVDVSPSALPSRLAPRWVRAIRSLRRALPICGSDLRGHVPSALIVSASSRSSPSSAADFDVGLGGVLLKLIC